MAAIRLKARHIEKPWGRRDLPAPFAMTGDENRPIGEIWFEDGRGGDPELLIKYLFTSEKLSIQVHPDNQAARKAGYRRGKDEAWVVLAAEPGAAIGIGLCQLVSRDELRAAVIDGRIEDMIDWRPAKAGQSYYSPAGTVHALGAGLVLVEIQQNVDLTYRLFDYGRGRTLHLAEGVAAANPAPYVAPFTPYSMNAGRHILANGPAFVLERWVGSFAGTMESERPFWLALIGGSGVIDGETLEPGGVWVVEGGAEIAVAEGSDMLIAYPGTGVEKNLLS